MCRSKRTDQEIRFRSSIPLPRSVPTEGGDRKGFTAGKGEVVREFMVPRASTVAARYGSRVFIVVAAQKGDLCLLSISDKFPYRYLVSTLDQSKALTGNTCIVSVVRYCYYTSPRRGRRLTTPAQLHKLLSPSP